MVETIASREDPKGARNWMSKTNAENIRAWPFVAVVLVLATLTACCNVE